MEFWAPSVQGLLLWTHWLLACLFEGSKLGTVHILELH